MFKIPLPNVGEFECDACGSPFVEKPYQFMITHKCGHKKCYDCLPEHGVGDLYCYFLDCKDKKSEDAEKKKKEEVVQETQLLANKESSELTNVKKGLGGWGSLSFNNLKIPIGPTDLGHGLGPFHCGKCPRVFKYQGAFNCHQLIHLDGEPSSNQLDGGFRKSQVDRRSFATEPAIKKRKLVVVGSSWIGTQSQLTISGNKISPTDDDEKPDGLF